jgi:enoyl-[acyl-carrier protein] reductase II
MFQNRLTRLLGIRLPIIQAGMVWASGWELAAAVSRAGGLGIIAGGSFYPDALRDAIRRCRAATDSPFAVNLPLMYPHAAAHIDVILAEQVPIVFTSAGNPKTWTQTLKSAGCKVVHVVSSSHFARKAEDAGCDAVVAEGFEAGGHNGREETTTFVLLPLVRAAVDIPVIAAGGIVTGRQMFAAMALGAEGVQMGTRFVASRESCAHDAFKRAVIAAGEGSTRLMMKKLTPVRLLQNTFSERIRKAEDEGAGSETLREMLGKGRARIGMSEGDLEEGELEIGQAAALLDDILPAGRIMEAVWNEFGEAVRNPFFGQPLA